MPTCTNQSGYNSAAYLANYDLIVAIAVAAQEQILGTPPQTNGWSRINASNYISSLCQHVLGRASPWEASYYPTLLCNGTMTGEAAKVFVLSCPECMQKYGCS